jgi:hypothetical protein
MSARSGNQKPEFGYAGDAPNRDSEKKGPHRKSGIIACLKENCFLPGPGKFLLLWKPERETCDEDNDRDHDYVLVIGRHIVDGNITTNSIRLRKKIPSRDPNPIGPISFVCSVP